MKLSSFFVVAFFVTVLVGCATPYQEVTGFNISGGYYDELLPTGEYKVGFGGNGYTSTTTAMDYALLRCSEITIAQGKKYFEIVQGGGGRADEAYWNGYGVSYSSKPNAEYVIRLHDVEPSKAYGKIYNAEKTRALIMQRNSLDANYKVRKRKIKVAD